MAMGGERRGHPELALIIVVVTVAVVGVLCVAWLLGAKGLEEGDSGVPWTGADYAPWAITCSVILVGGLLLAWRVGRGGGVDPAEAQGPGRTWHVTDEVSLVDSPRRGSVVAHLPPATAVVEVGRHGHYIQVIAPGGRTGWVRRRSLY